MTDNGKKMQSEKPTLNKLLNKYEFSYRQLWSQFADYTEFYKLALKVWHDSKKRPYASEIFKFRFQSKNITEESYSVSRQLFLGILGYKRHRP